MGFKFSPGSTPRSFHQLQIHSFQSTRFWWTLAFKNLPNGPVFQNLIPKLGSKSRQFDTIFKSLGCLVMITLNAPDPRKTIMFPGGRNDDEFYSLSLSPFLQNEPRNLQDLLDKAGFSIFAIDFQCYWRNPEWRKTQISFHNLIKP